MKFKSDPVKLENRFDSVRLDMFLNNIIAFTCLTIILHNNAGATNNLPGLALRINLA